MKLTKAAVAQMTLPPGKSELVVFDDEVPGFALRLRASGARIFVFHYRHGPIQRRISIGTATAIPAAEARAQAIKLYAAVKLGGDPAGDRYASQARAAETFGAAVEIYLARQKQRLRRSSYVAVERHLQVCAKTLHRLPLTQVDRRAIAALLTKTETAVSGATVNCLRTSLSGFCAFAVREGLIESNPVAGTEQRDETPRTRLLLDSEIAEIWAALEDDTYAAIMKLLILTGARRAELGALRPSEVHLDRSLILLPGNRTKNDREHQILLSAPAIEILRTRPFDREFVLGRGQYGFHDWAKGKIELDQRILANRRAAAKRAGTDPTKVEAIGFTPHDFRRYLSSTMNGRMGIAPHIVEEILGHVGAHRGVAGTYNLGFPEREVRTAMERWGGFVLDVVEGRPHNIVPLLHA